jgi:hypothetical protein
VLDPDCSTEGVVCKDLQLLLGGVTMICNFMYHLHSANICVTVNSYYFILIQVFCILIFGQSNNYVFVQYFASCQLLGFRLWFVTLILLCHK